MRRLLTARVRSGAHLGGARAGGAEAGVENVLDILRSGIDSALLGLGHASVQDLCRGDLLVPASFTRHPGIPAGDPVAGHALA